MLTSYIRPEYLSGDESGKIETIVDLLQYEEQKRNTVYEFVLDLDITSPLRTFNDLDESFAILKADKQALNLFSVNPAGRNPYFNMVEQKPNGYYGLVKKGDFLTRQMAPLVYEMNASFYFYRREFFTSGCRSAITEKSLIYTMPHTCFDLDHMIDFEFMEYLMVNNKLTFQI